MPKPINRELLGAPMASRDAVMPALPRNFMRSCVMLLLSDSPAYGYQLLAGLTPLALGRDPGRMYRVLHALREEGLITSSWQSSDIGPDRHWYELAPAGAKAVDDAARALQVTHLVIERFLDLYRIAESRTRWLRDHPTALSVSALVPTQDASVGTSAHDEMQPRSPRLAGAA